MAFLGIPWLASSDPTLVGLEVEPTRVTLRGSDGAAQVIVTGRASDGCPRDLTAEAHYSVLDPGVVAVGAEGLIHPRGDGSTTVEVRAGNLVARVEVVVSDFADARPVRFLGEVMPILTRSGCNAGGCHGKSSGQNGFRLSLLGFDPASDYEAIVEEGRGRRVFPSRPENSLLLKKPTAQVAHGGGRRFAIGSTEARTLARWISQGMPSGRGTEPSLVGLSVEPARRVVPRRGQQ